MDKQFQVAWQEFDAKDRMVTKRRSFATFKAMKTFINKLIEKPNFYQIYSYSDPLD